MATKTKKAMKDRSRLPVNMIDSFYLRDTLEQLVHIPSPTGFTDRAVHFVCNELERLGIAYEVTRRGGIRASLVGKRHSPDRAIVSHVDTLGAMVRSLEDNGRPGLKMVGHWSPRFAEGARCTLFTDHHAYRGTILPLKASGHTFNEEIDTQPVSWDNLELRIDEDVHDRAGLEALGINVGDFVAIDPGYEYTSSGYINTRHLDNKAGVALMLAAARAVTESKVTLPIDCHLLFTISEEVGSGASSILHGDVSEMLTIDNGCTARGQNSRETGVTIAMADMVGPFDYHLSRKLIGLCRDHDIPHQRDVFRYYRCDSASAIEAGNDIRTALATFGIDASHGYERIHESALTDLARLVAAYMCSGETDERDAEALQDSIEGFSDDQIPDDWEGPV